MAKKVSPNDILIQQAVDVIAKLGIPLDELSEHRIKRMAQVFLAVCQVNAQAGWKGVKDLNDRVAIKTREIITYVNENFGEEISSGSYDDIRRKDLKFLVLADIVVRSNPNAARNDATRGYALNPEYKEIISSIGSSDWDARLKTFAATRVPVSTLLMQPRDIKTIPVILPSNEELKFSPGEHNVLQKAIIEDLLSRYGYGAEVLYVGDTADKFLYVEEGKLKALNFFEIAHGELPDIIAYSAERNWLFLVEAVHTSGPISSARLLELQRLTKDCTADIVYITAFLDRETLRKFIKDIAWETEVWIASNPDHMIHLNGDKFMGPYKKTS